jgi:hypothetical protein
MRRVFFATFVLSLCVSACSAEERLNVVRSPETIDNGLVKVVWYPDGGYFRAWCGQRCFITEGRLTRDDGKQVDTVTGVKTEGKSIIIKYPDGAADTISLHDGSPFIRLQTRIANATDKAITVNKITTAKVTIDTGKSPADIRLLGCDGLTDGKAERTSFSYLAAADPNTRSGVVAGWLTHHRGSGIVLSKVNDGKLHIDGRLEYGKLLIEPDHTADGETFVIGCFDDARRGLEAYADAAAKANNVKLNPVTSGYCTWYSNPHGGASDETHMAELADFCERELTKFGFEVLQIDDKWQISGRDFTTHKPTGPYPGGMKPTADKITSAGMTAGIWYIPFGWDHTRDIFKDHQDWFVKTESGEPYTVHWAGTCLDMTHPEARDFLSEVVARMSKEWGYKYIKIDGLWTGLAAKITYPQPAYKDDNLGDATFHDPARTNLEAYRDGLKLVRRAAGDDVFILGCNIAQNMRTLGASFGLVDGMRVGRDISASWSKILPCVEMGSRLYFMHWRLWYNDPDCLMVREPLTLDQARAWGSWIAVTGELNLVSEWLPGLPADRLDIVKRSMPNHGLCARPVDLLDTDIPCIWQLTDTRTNTRRDVIGIFNWDDKEPQTISVPIDRLDLPASPTGKYVGFEYWSRSYIAPFADRIELILPPASCKVVALRPALEHPVIISTSRHISQGIVDIIEEKWDASSLTLSGKSKLVADDPYRIRIAVPDNSWSVDTITTFGNVRNRLVANSPAGMIEVELQSPETTPTAWRIHLAK